MSGRFSLEAFLGILPQSGLLAFSPAVRSPRNGRVEDASHNPIEHIADKDVKLEWEAVVYFFFRFPR